MSRSKPGYAHADLLTGEGLAEALDGIDVVVHAATDGRRDVTATAKLIEALEAAGRPQLVFVSIVGVDRIPLGYYKDKVTIEGMVAAYGGTSLRASQFHDLVLSMAKALTKLPLVGFYPAFDVRPVEVHDVAVRLAEIVEGATAGAAGRFLRPAAAQHASAVAGIPHPNRQTTAARPDQAARTDLPGATGRRGNRARRRDRDVGGVPGPEAVSGGIRRNPTAAATPAAATSATVKSRRDTSVVAHAVAHGTPRPARPSAIRNSRAPSPDGATMTNVLMLMARAIAKTLPARPCRPGRCARTSSHTCRPAARYPPTHHAMLERIGRQVIGRSSGGRAAPPSPG